MDFGMSTLIKTEIICHNVFNMVNVWIREIKEECRSKSLQKQKHNDL